jgi:SAM-dependent methyltransferase
MRARSVARRARLGLWRLTHRGDARRCPACGLVTGKFAPYGSRGRPDAQCPRCGSVERHRALALFLARHPTVDLANDRVLAVSPDPHLERLGRRNPAYLSIDLVPGLAMEAMDLTSLRLPDAERDVVIAFHVLEHISDDKAAMDEIARVLRPGGQAILEVPVTEGATDEQYRDAPPEVRTEHYGQPDHVRMYGRADFEARLRAAGLEPQAIRVREALAEEMERAALDPDEVFHVATRVER